MSRRYSAEAVVFEYRKRYLIWHTDGPDDEEDGVVIGEDGKVALFKTIEDLLGYAANRGLPAVRIGEIEGSNFDSVRRWLKRKRPVEMNCNQVLTVWNMLEDISCS